MQSAPDPDGEQEVEMEMPGPENEENNDPTPANEKPGMMDDTGTKIDYSTYDPIPFKKTSTLVNYFIINTA